MSAQADDFAVRRQLVQMQMLYEVGLALSESLDPSHVAEQVLHRALAAVDARAGLLMMDADESSAISQIGFDNQMDEIAALSEVTAAWSRTTGTSLDRGEVHSPRFLYIQPLRFREQPAGLLIVADKEQRDQAASRFDEGDQSLLESFAMQAGAALRNARLHGDLQTTYDALQAAQEKIAQLEQLRALGDLAGEVTHALRHSLGLVIGHADTYLAFESDPKKAMESVLSAADEGQQLIHRIDRVTRLGVGRERSLQDLNALVETALANAQKLESACGIEWRVETAADLPATHLNPADMTEVLVNLLLNAAQAVGDHGQVSVSTALDDEQLMICVRDSGPGVAEAIQQQIFDPFFTTRDGGGGTGLGLSIVLRIVEDHGGTVALASSAEGASFSVRLPVLNEAPAESLADSLADSSADELLGGDDTENPGRR